MPPSKTDKVMSIRLSPEDQDAIAQIKARYGIRHDVEAIRLALRLTAEQPRTPPQENAPR